MEKGGKEEEEEEERRLGGNVLMWMAALSPVPAGVCPFLNAAVTQGEGLVSARVTVL